MYTKETIRKIVEQIMEEISGSKEYLKCSIKFETKNPEIAKNYLLMAKQEIEHAEHLNDILQTIQSLSETTDDVKNIIEFICEIIKERISNTLIYFK